MLGRIGRTTMFLQDEGTTPADETTPVAGGDDMATDAGTDDTAAAPATDDNASM